MDYQSFTVARLSVCVREDLTNKNTRGHLASAGTLFHVPNSPSVSMCSDDTIFKISASKVPFHFFPGFPLHYSRQPFAVSGRQIVEVLPWPLVQPWPWMLYVEFARFLCDHVAFFRVLWFPTSQRSVGLVKWQLRIPRVLQSEENWWECGEIL